MDVNACTDAGIIVTDIAGSTSEEVSDHALAVLMASARELKRLDKATCEGRWNEVSRELASRDWPYSRSVVISGCGR